MGMVSARWNKNFHFGVSLYSYSTTVYVNEWARLLVPGIKSVFCLHESLHIFTHLSLKMKVKGPR